MISQICLLLNTENVQNKIENEFNVEINCMTHCKILSKYLNKKRRMYYFHKGEGEDS